MSLPPTLDYRPPRSPLNNPNRGVGLLLAGVGVGLALSLAGWWSAFRFDLDPTKAFVIAFVMLVGGKIALGIFVDRKAGRAGFLSGILLSIALVPLIGIGTVAYLCFHAG